MDAEIAVEKALASHVILVILEFWVHVPALCTGRDTSREACTQTYQVVMFHEQPCIYLPTSTPLP